MNYQIKHAVEKLLKVDGIDEARHAVSMSGLTSEEAMECYAIIDDHEARLLRAESAMAENGELDDLEV
jgi:hypothetical protein